MNLDLIFIRLLEWNWQIGKIVDYNKSRYMYNVSFLCGHKLLWFHCYTIAVTQYVPKVCHIFCRVRTSPNLQVQTLCYDGVVLNMILISNLRMDFM